MACSDEQMARYHRHGSFTRYTPSLLDLSDSSCLLESVDILSEYCRFACNHLCDI